MLLLVNVLCVFISGFFAYQAYKKGWMASAWLNGAAALINLVIVIVVGTAHLAADPEADEYNRDLPAQR